jgi:hypothetical protein
MYQFSLCLLLVCFSISNGFRPLRQRGMSYPLFTASNTPEAYKKFCVSVNVFVKPERREEFLKVIAGNAAGTRSNEPLNLSYTWGESTTEKNTFHFQVDKTPRDNEVNDSLFIFFSLEVLY